MPGSPRRITARPRAGGGDALEQGQEHRELGAPAGEKPARRTAPRWRAARYAMGTGGHVARQGSH